MFKAGFIVAASQFVAVVFLGLIALLWQPSSLEHRVDVIQTVRLPNSDYVVRAIENEYRTSFRTSVALADILIAIAFIAMFRNTVKESARSIKDWARQRQPKSPLIAVNEFTALSGVLAIFLIAIALRKPPDSLFIVLSRLNLSNSVSLDLVVWVSTFSVLFAFFGATARAAWLARSFSET